MINGETFSDFGPFFSFGSLSVRPVDFDSITPIPMAAPETFTSVFDIEFSFSESYAGAQGLPNADPISFRGSVTGEAVYEYSKSDRVFPDANGNLLPDYDIDRITYRFADQGSNQNAVPEPGSLVIWSLLGLSVIGFRRRKALLRV